MLTKLSDGGAEGSSIAGLLVLVVLVFANLLDEDELESARPHGAAHHESLAGDSSRARIWEDPLAAVEGTEHSEISAVEAILSGHWSGVLHLEIPEAELGQVSVLAVHLTPGPLPDQRERRMRTRHAVVASLSHAGFGPWDAFRLPSFRLSHGKREIPYQWFVSEEREAHVGDESGPASIVRARSGVLVIWVDEGTLERHPLAFHHSLRSRVFSRLHSRVAEVEASYSVIGPATSDTLEQIVQEAREERDSEWDKGTLGQIFSDRSTAQVEAPSAEDSESDGLLHGFELVHCIESDKQLALVLAGELQLRSPSLLLNQVSEQGVKDATPRESWVLGQTRTFLDVLGFVPDFEERPVVALITEEDSEFGRRWATAFGEAVRGMQSIGGSAEESEDSPVRVIRYPYFSGLDGRSARSSIGPEIVWDAAAGDDQHTDYPAGSSQFDYVRRLADTIDELNEDQNLIGVGVIGSDIHDKLQIIQALSEKLRGVMLFTTNLDASYFHDAHLSHTKNLVVGSFFSLEPTTDHGVRGAPEGVETRPLGFRDSYQVSTFHAVARAIGEPHDRAAPRVFEIGKRGPVELVTPVAMGAGQGAVRANVVAGRPLPSLWNSFQEASGMFKKAFVGKALPHGESEERGWKTLAIWSIAALMLFRIVLVIFGQRLVPGEGLVLVVAVLAELCLVADWKISWWEDLMTILGPVQIVGGVLVLAIGLIMLSPAKELLEEHLGGLKGVGLRGWMAGVAILLGFTVSVGLLQHRIYEYESDGVRTMEPFSLVSGTSTWPAVFLRLVVFWFSVGSLLLIVLVLRKCKLQAEEEYFGRRVRQGLRASYTSRKEELVKACADRNLGTDPSEDALAAERSRLRESSRIKLSAVRATILHLFGNVSRAREKDFESIEELWRYGYLWWNYWPGRLLRSILGALVFYCALRPFFREFGFPVPPVRGAYNYLIERGVTFAALISVLTLLFYVMSATLTCGGFCRMMTRKSNARWTKSSIARHVRKLRLTARETVQIRRIQLAQDLTAVMDKLVYFPAIALCFLVVSHFQFFDKWVWTPALIIAFAVLIPIPFFCCWWTRSAARVTREKTLEYFSDRQIGLAHHEERRRSRLSLVVNELNSLQKGAFAPLIQHPILRAVLLPFALLGSGSILQYLTH